MRSNAKWTLASSLDVLEAQVACVQRFAGENFLRLNTRKCEVVVFSIDSHTAYPECEIQGEAIPVGSEGKCLGYWWRGELMANRAVEEGIKKARRSFFHFGSIGVFQGDLSPLSSRTVVESCVLPVLLYGSENWVLTEQLISRLEAFQGEVAKRILKLPKWSSNTAANVVMSWPPVRARILVQKLGFLHRLVSEMRGRLGGRVLASLSDDVEALCLVKECRELERDFGTKYTERLLEEGG